MKLHLRGRYAVLILTVGVLFGVASPLTSIAQGTGGASITGTVTDLHGRVIQNAAVILKNESSGRVQHSTTDNQGRFAVSGLPAGRYDLTITAPGFAAAIQTGLLLTADQTQNVPVQMNIGTLSQSVEIEAIAGDSIAAQHALSQDSLDTEVPKSEISSEFSKEFTPPTAEARQVHECGP